MPRRPGAKELLRRFLRKRVGKIVTTRELRDAAGNVTQYARRIRELREEGWKIHTHHDDASLKPDEYKLVCEPPDTYTPAKLLSDRERAQVLRRDGGTCQLCGRAAGDLDEQGRRVHIQAGHIEGKQQGGDTNLSNFRAECNRCNEGASQLAEAPPSRVSLMTQIRRARRDDQKHALEWLRHKFGT